MCTIITNFLHHTEIPEEVIEKEEQSTCYARKRECCGINFIPCKIDEKRRAINENLLRLHFDPLSCKSDFSIGEKKDL